jgi:hypothetical protein
MVAAATALFAVALCLGAFGEPTPVPAVPTLANQQRLLPSQQPMIIVAAAINAPPALRTPLLIEIGPPQWVPADSALYVHGVLPQFSLSRGRRRSADLWSIPIAALADLAIDVAADASGRADLTFSLVGASGSPLAKATTTIVVSADAHAGGRPAERQAATVPAVAKQPRPMPEPFFASSGNARPAEDSGRSGRQPFAPESMMGAGSGQPDLREPRSAWPQSELRQSQSPGEARPVATPARRTAEASPPSVTPSRSAPLAERLEPRAAEVYFGAGRSEP